MLSDIVILLQKLILMRNWRKHICNTFKFWNTKLFIIIIFISPKNIFASRPQTPHTLMLVFNTASLLKECSQRKVLTVHWVRASLRQLWCSSDFLQQCCNHCLLFHCSNVATDVIHHLRISLYCHHGLQMWCQNTVVLQHYTGVT